jgi:phosphopantothenoylcysteine decarboxylase/phosphopantothenate--cysteine ligase
LPVDAAIMAAAVADWRPAQSQDAKIKKTKSGLDDLKLVENPDILATLAAHATQRPSLVVGFAAETNDIESYASEKRVRKKCDWIVANDVSANSGIAGGVMGGDENQIHLLTASGSEPWEVMSKTDVAVKLAAQIATYFATHEETA